MQLTRKSDYAIRCVLHLSRDPEAVASVEEISRAMFLPKIFLAKILQSLMKAGIVRSTRGIKGGFQLAKRPKDINLLEVIEAIQGPSAPNICTTGKNMCRLSGGCSVHPVWIKIKEMVEKELKRTNFAVLSERL